MVFFCRIFDWPNRIGGKVAFNSILSNFIDLNVELHMHLIPELVSAREIPRLNRALLSQSSFG